MIAFIQVETKIYVNSSGYMTSTSMAAIPLYGKKRQKSSSTDLQLTFR